MKLRAFAVPLCLVLLGSLAVAQDLCGPGGPAVGTGFFSSIINYSNTGDLFFSVRQAPPNVCGNLVTTRNGSLLCSPGWICTDASGNASANSGGTSSWSWANQPNDQTDTNVHFNWTDGTTTYFTTNHYWDKTCPTPRIDQPSGSLPGAFSGNGTDTLWGAGFLSPGTKVKLTFARTPLAGGTPSYWNPSTGLYELASPPDIFATVSGLGSIGPGLFDSPSYSITWDGTASIPYSFPPGSYTWDVILLDADSRCQEHAPNPIQFSCTRLNPC